MERAGEPPKRFKTINGLKMAYVDTGTPYEGAPTVWLQHGNPTSSYLWRHVIDRLKPTMRCIAPDLIGMGDSAKLSDSGPDAYGFATHFEHVCALIDALVPDTPLILVLHDWGSALGFHFATRNLNRVAGVVYMEAIVQPLSWSDWPETARDMFQALRTEAGETMILDKNLFVERVLPSAIMRTLSPPEMAVYRRPFLLKGEDRRPTVSWPRQLPIDGTPADIVDLVSAYGPVMRNAPFPKLFINADPGSILVGPQRDFCRTWANQEEVTVSGLHYLQEDSGPQIGHVIGRWAAEKGLCPQRSA